MINGLPLPNDPVTRAALQTLITAYNQLMRDFEAIKQESLKPPEPTLLHGWLGVIRDSGPADEDDVDGAQYWVEKLQPWSNDNTTLQDPTTEMAVKGEFDIYNAHVSDATYVVATNIAEATLDDDSDDGTVTSSGHSLSPGDLVRVFTLSGAGKFHYFSGTKDDFQGYFKVSANSQDGSNKRWSYTMVEQEKSAAAYGGWTTKSDGGRVLTAYNDQEEDNGSSGLYGNGITSTNLTGTFDVQPIPTGKGVHRVYRVTLSDGSATEYWFSASNGVDGGCS